MTDSRKTGVVIVAGGVGSRFGGNIPKQYCLMNGRPLLMHTIERFREALPGCDIILAISKPMEEYWIRLCMEYGFLSPRTVYGGKERKDSVYNALKTLTEESDCSKVLIHDGVRPLVSHEVILNVANAVVAGIGVAPAIPESDSLRETTGDGTTVSVDRSRYMRIQTPQGFMLGELVDCYERLEGNVTDDLSVAERNGIDIILVKGDSRNIKITNPEDILIAEAIAE